MQLKQHLLLILLAGFALTATAQPRESIEGVHYQPLAKAVPVETDEDVIEVREVFWYGCPECFTLEPIMTEWGQGVRGDLKLFRTPAVWNDIMALHARIYFSAVEVGAESRIHQAAFQAIHENNNPLRSRDQIEALFLANGVSADTFASAWDSDAVNAAVQQARLRTSDYAIDKLPSIIISGRFKVTHNAQVFNHIELNIAVNEVVRRMRDERRADF